VFSIVQGSTSDEKYLTLEEENSKELEGTEPVCSLSLKKYCFLQSDWKAL
jgi:hypothetical protein